jgi:hypothetical protein
VIKKLGAVRAVVSGSRVQVQRRGRLCAQEGCDTVLSVYNPVPFCSLHEHASQAPVETA